MSTDLPLRRRWDRPNEGARLVSVEPTTFCEAGWTLDVQHDQQGEKDASWKRVREETKGKISKSLEVAKGRG